MISPIFFRIFHLDISLPENLFARIPQVFLYSPINLKNERGNTLTHVCASNSQYSVVEVGNLFRFSICFTNWVPANPIPEDLTYWRWNNGIHQ